MTETSASHAAHDVAVSLRSLSESSTARHQATLGLLGELRRLGLGERLGDLVDRIERAPDDLTALLTLSALLLQEGRWSIAATAAIHCLARDDRRAEAYSILAACYRALRDLTLAVAAAERAVTLRPSDANVRADLAFTLAQANQTEAAIQCYEAAYRLDGNPRHLVLAMTCVPVVYRSLEHMLECRALLGEALRILPSVVPRLASPVDSAFNLFFLAYQGLDDRPFMEAKAAFVTQAVPSAGHVRADLAHGGHPAFVRGRRRIRLGLVSTRFKEHTIGRLFYGMVRHFPRDDFELTVFSPPVGEDPLVRGYREAADHHVTVPAELDAFRREIGSRRLDLLFYTDIGMDPLVSALAFSRLAPAQIVSWGHPVTSGVPTVDYFLSSDDLETEGSEQHYSETLLKASRVTACYQRPDVKIPDVGRAELGLPPTGTLYLCPQAPMKLHPELDALLAGILRADPDGVVLLQQPWHDAVGAVVSQRLHGHLGPDLERVLFLPFLPREEYLAVMRAADVMLDPIHFGGGNTNYEACHVGLPVVTWPSRHMRGRFAYALYRQMEIDDTIACDGADYVRKAVAIGTDRRRRQELSDRILARADRVFDDRGVLEEVARMFIRIAEQPRGVPTRRASD